MTREQQAQLMNATMLDAQRRANRPYLPTRADLEREAHALEMARLRRMDGFVVGVSVVGILAAVAAMIVVVVRNFA